MKFEKNDIVVRREKNGRVVTWLSERIACVFFDVTEDYLRQTARYKYRMSVKKHRRDQNLMPDTGKEWRYAYWQGKFYYDFDRIPKGGKQIKEAEEIVKIYQDALAQGQYLEVDREVDRALSDGFQEYIHRYNELSDEHCYALSRACGVVMVGVKWALANPDKVRKSEYWQDLASVVQKRAVRYVPNNWRRLKEKVLAVVEGRDITEVIDLPRAGNSNALRHADAELLSWLFQLRRAPQNYTDAHIIREIRKVCRMAGKATPSQSWFEQLLNEPKTKFLTFDRFGSGRQGNLTPYTPVANAIFAGDCWQVDGTRINFLPYINEKGREEFLYIIAVIDVYSGDVVGWHFCVNEDRHAYTAAMKMAISNTGYTPWELVLDRFPGHNTEEWQHFESRLRKYGTKVTYTSKKTGKAKVERFFGTLQSIFLQKSNYYYGEGIQSRRVAAHRSPEYLKSMKRVARGEGWNREKAEAEATACIELYRNTKYSEYSRRYKEIEQSPKHLHDVCDKAHAHQVEIWETLELFGKEKRVKLARGGMITTEIARQRITYYVNDMEVIMNHTRVALVYDLEDINEVYLYEDSDQINRKFLGIATIAKPVQLYGPNANADELSAAMERQAHIEKQRQQAQQEIVQQGAELDLLNGPWTIKGASADAETAWLHEYVHQPAAYAKRIPSLDEDDGSNLKIDIRSQY